MEDDIEYSNKELFFEALNEVLDGILEIIYDLFGKVCQREQPSEED